MVPKVTRTHPGNSHPKGNKQEEVVHSTRDILYPLFLQEEFSTNWWVLNKGIVNTESGYARPLQLISSRNSAGNVILFIAHILI